MERSEPTLVPEWLKRTGTVSGGSASHSDERTASNLSRSKSFVNSNGEFGRSISSVKTTSSYFHRSSSSNGSGHMRSRSNCGRNRNRHGREYDRGYDLLDKNKSISGDHRGRDFSDVQGNTLFGKFERNGLHRSESMFSRKHGDTWHKKAITDSSIATARNNDGLPSKGNSFGQASKVTFERDFPSLGAEERAVTSQIGRVPSPGLTLAIQSLPISSSAVNSDETFTSVLAEVPVLVGSSGTGTSSMQQVALGTPSNLNMAEAVAQGPKCTQITPQLSMETQRLEELAIKQSRQLIPVTPSMPKTLVSSSSDKQKTKVGQQQHAASSSFAVNHSQRANAPVKSEASKLSNVGKLHVLKPVREKNSIAPVVKDNLSPRNGCSLLSSTFTAASVSGSAPTCDAPNVSGCESKPAFNLLEKRPSSQGQSRSDFFNSVRRKSMANSSSVAGSSVSNLSSDPDTSSAVPASVSDNVAETEVINAPNASQDGNGLHSINPSGSPLSKTACVVHGSNDVKTGGKLPTFDPIFPEEEEAAFLRSLGWEENADEGGLTEEEINAFFRDVAKYINSKPSLKLPQVGPKFLLPFKPHAVGIRSSDAKLES